MPARTEGDHENDRIILPGLPISRTTSYIYLILSHPASAQLRKFPPTHTLKWSLTFSLPPENWYPYLISPMHATFPHSCTPKGLKGGASAWKFNLILINLLTAIGLSPGGSSTVHIYTQTIHRTIQNKQYIEQHNNFGRVRAVPRLGVDQRIIPKRVYSWRHVTVLGGNDL